MPGPALLAPLAAAGIGAGFNALSQSFQNAKSREWATQMYDRQYSDNLSFWKMQNAYNDPSSQMARLKNAGLNPALMYGGAGGATGQAGSIQTPDVQRPEFNPPQVGDILGEGLSSVHQIYDLEVKEQQLDNMKTKNLVDLQQAAYLSAQTGRSEFDLGVASDLREYTVEAGREAVRKAKVDRQFQTDENFRRTMKNSVDIREGVSRILSQEMQRTKDKEEIIRIQALVKNINMDTGLKSIEKDLLDIGLSKNSNILLKVIARTLKNMGPEDSFSDRLASIFEYLFTPENKNYKKN